MLSDVEIIDRVRHGDVPAFENLIRKYQDQVFRFALYMLPSRQDAEDVAQETFIKAYQSIGRFRGDASLGTWLMAIARRSVAQWYRRRKVEHKLDEMDEQPVSGMEMSVEHLEVRATVAKLPDHYREIVVLRYTEQLDLNEIAAITGLSRNAVAARLCRARQALRKALSPLSGQEECNDEL